MGAEGNYIDLSDAHRKEISSLLKQHIPETEMWVYGSRVTGESGPTSDLDVVVFTSPALRSVVYDLQEAFEQSSLPFRVDLFVWDEIPLQFRKTIEEKHLVLQGKSQ